MEDMKNGLIMMLRNSSQQALPRPSGLSAPAAAPMLAHKLAIFAGPAWLRDQGGRQHLFILKPASSLEVQGLFQ